MAAPLRIPRFQQATPFVDGQGRLSNEALRRLNEAFAKIEGTLNAIAALPEIQEGLANAGQLITDAQDAAAAANQAAADANAAAVAAQREAALTSSYIAPSSVLSADPTTITVAAHTRYYGDGTSVAVNGATIPATAPADTDYVFYDDPARAGGTVAYQVSTTAPVQTGNRHVVGAVVIPATGTQAGGSGPRPPGFVSPTPEP